MFEIDFLPAALDDIEQTKNWYNKKKENLGYEFVKEIEKIIELVILNPYSFAKKYKEMRQVKINRFPFFISYIINDINVVVLSVLHTSCNPNEFTKRYK
ncbi:MAG: type II toxin-antitoxin system RelE/ParE family toxin [Bacteroidales bacterium]|nr:type II toxin-antitoxin system RelE/ParE family toxin [Bacteroidales bacterium]